ncbi:hypothetical protein M409DRAFT_21168 [Zasmidium cellare ATCC 36951]|uniref:Uncharacterized protein n=1 Tax=Zasmidium cellare ATCC 36951 TaxID=1080233 RepID=A0A6A6CQC0_ZASCE|nr:uncharacterized protein M409DRAFT_21168 [Zasmidium cellare ATCC 36951]KAF2168418.1 hypothetical protein M409DRAFT_21168 [Zasmidium cellare ATCC 36951]
MDAWSLLGAAQQELAEKKEDKTRLNNTITSLQSQVTGLGQQNAVQEDRIEKLEHDNVRKEGAIQAKHATMCAAGNASLVARDHVTVLVEENERLKGVLDAERKAHEATKTREGELELALQAELAKKKAP